MNLSDEHSLLFFPIPKTGCTSIIHSTHGLFTPLTGHVQAVDVMQQEPDIWERCFSFAIVRNPWDRMASLWSYLRGMKLGVPGGKGPSDALLLAVRKCVGFGEFVRWAEAEGVAVDRHFYPQCHWVCDGDSVIVDFVGRFETLQQDWDCVCRRVGLGVKPLPRLNTSAHKPYTELYDGMTAKIIGRMYSEDIDRFGYTFLGEG